MITLFIDQNAQDLLDDIGGGFPEALNKLDTTVEFIHLALTGVVKYNESGDLDITVYERDEAMTRTRIGGHGTVINMELNVDRGDFDTIAVVAGISDLMNNYLLSENLIERYKELDEESGVFVEAKDGRILTSVVSGRNRPDLRCRMISGEKRMYRPYTDEAFEAFKSSGDDNEEIEKKHYSMFVGYCDDCGYFDLIYPNSEASCNRCPGRMRSLGLTSMEWNLLSNDDKFNPSRIAEKANEIRIREEEDVHKSKEKSLNSVLPTVDCMNTIQRGLDATGLPSDRDSVLNLSIEDAYKAFSAGLSQNQNE